MLVFFGHDLHAQLPLGVIAAFNRFPQVTTVVVSIFTGQLLRLIPYQGAGADFRTPVEFHEAGLTFGIDQSEGVHPKALHGAQAFWNGAVGHGPDHHVRGFRLQRNKVPERIVGRTAGRNLVMRLGFHRVDEVWKFDRILDEEHRHVVAHQVEVAFVGEELHGKTAHVTHGVAGTTRALHRGKTCEHRGFMLRRAQETCLGQRRMVAVTLEIAMGARTTGMHDALRDALMVEVRDLFAHDEVFEQRRAARADFQAVLVIGNLHALISAQGLAGRIGTEFFQRLQFGVGVATVQGIGTRKFTLGRGGWLLGTHQSKLLIQSGQSGPRLV